MAYLAEANYGEPPPTPRTCDNRRIPERGAVQPVRARSVACTQRNAFNVADPVGIISRAVERALEMLNNTISELVNARNSVCGGATPAWPLLADITLEWLRNRLGVCIDDIRVWTAGTFVNGSVAEVIRRLVRVRNLIGSGSLRYTCTGAYCVRGDWAYTFPYNAAGRCLPGTPELLIGLCEAFWVPAINPATRRQIPLAVHEEFQAQTVIHEASHLTHCTSDWPGSTIGVSECLAQFVAATNGAPIDEIGFGKRCLVTNRCGPAAGVAEPGNAGLGFAGPGSRRVAKTTFQPQNAIRLKGRPAMRR